MKVVLIFELRHFVWKYQFINLKIDNPDWLSTYAHASVLNYFGRMPYINYIFS
jgi:hypothetical protein